MHGDGGADGESDAEGDGVRIDPIICFQVLSIFCVRHYVHFKSVDDWKKVFLLNCEGAIVIFLYFCKTKL